MLFRSVSQSRYGGLSGIDGNVSYAIGAAWGWQKPVVALLGDLSFLHDLSGLLALRDSPKAICFVVIHNQGGRIFKWLQPSNSPDYYDALFITDQKIHDFSHIAAQFQIQYHRLTALNSITPTLQAWDQLTHQFIEVVIE